jgi:hypothetical protein
LVAIVSVARDEADGETVVGGLDATSPVVP